MTRRFDLLYQTLLSQCISNYFNRLGAVLHIDGVRLFMLVFVPHQAPNGPRFKPAMIGQRSASLSRGLGPGWGAFRKAPRPPAPMACNPFLPPTSFAPPSCDLVSRYEWYKKSVWSAVMEKIHVEICFSEIRFLDILTMQSMPWDQF